MGLSDADLTRLLGTPDTARLLSRLRRRRADGVALPEFAACGLVLGAARVISRESEGSGAAWRRRVGVLKDELSSTVLALNLPGEDSTATGRGDRFGV